MTESLTDLIRRADLYLDTPAQSERYTELGEDFYNFFGSDQKRVSSQVRNLQQIVVSARRLGDIEAFVKNQMGKATGSQQWRQIGESVLEHLKLLRKKADELSADEVQRLPLRLHLAREWVRTVVGAYLYAKALNEMQKEKSDNV